MARFNSAKNFAGKQYATKFAVASMQNATGSQDFSKLKIVGDCNVAYNADGTITLRIGPALNCSVMNADDGISSAKVSYSVNNLQTVTISETYTNVNSGSRTIAVKGDKDTLKANCGTTQTTLTTKGNSVHFQGDGTGKFKVYIGSGKNAATQTAYTFGPITTSKTYYEDNKTSGGIACAITNYVDEPKKSSGANGKCANVNFTFTPESLFTETTDFKINKIEQIQIAEDGSQSVVATYKPTLNGVEDTKVYMFMAQTDAPGKPTSASYTLTKDTKTISGVTYLTNSTTMTPSAEGLVNCGYPGYVANKLNCAPSGGTWFTSFNETSTSNFTTWTTQKDVEMNWTGAAKNIIKGEWENPEIVVKGTNMHSSGTGVTSAQSIGKIYVCDSDGYVSSSSGTYADATRFVKGFANAFSSTDLTATNNEDLQTFDGCIVYPTKDFSVYNKNGGTAINPDYSGCSGTRYAYLKLTKSGTIMGGTVKINCAATPETSLTNGALKIQLSNKPNDETSWMDLMDIGTSFSYGTTTSIGFSIPQASSYGTGMMYCRVVMTKPASGQGVKIKSIALS